MYQSINKNLNKLYEFSGYIAAFFLALVAFFILIGISSRIFGFYIRGLAEYSGYCMAAASFYALAYTFVQGGHIRITLFLEKAPEGLKKILETWCYGVLPAVGSCSGAHRPEVVWTPSKKFIECSSFAIRCTRA